MKAVLRCQLCKKIIDQDLTLRPWVVISRKWVIAGGDVLDISIGRLVGVAPEAQCKCKIRRAAVVVVE